MFLNPQNTSKISFYSCVIWSNMNDLDLVISFAFSPPFLSIQHVGDINCINSNLINVKNNAINFERVAYRRGINTCGNFN